MEDKSKSSLRIPFQSPLDLGMSFIRSAGTLVSCSSCDLRDLTPWSGEKVRVICSLPHLTWTCTGW